jgi:hypothetical protein
MVPGIQKAPWSHQQEVVQLAILTQSELEALFYLQKLEVMCYLAMDLHQ